MAAETIRVQVLLKPHEAARLEAFCNTHGYKKSTFIARIIREHLDRELFPEQQALPLSTPNERGRR